jgi:hypothetical protein
MTSSLETTGFESISFQLSFCSNPAGAWLIIGVMGMLTTQTAKSSEKTESRLKYITSSRLLMMPDRGLDVFGASQGGGGIDRDSKKWAPSLT